MTTVMIPGPPIHRCSGDQAFCHKLRAARASIVLGLASAVETSSAAGHARCKMVLSGCSGQPSVPGRRGCSSKRVLAAAEMAIHRLLNHHVGRSFRLIVVQDLVQLKGGKPLPAGILYSNAC